MAMTCGYDWDGTFYLDRTTGAVRRLEDSKQYESCSWAGEMLKELEALRDELAANPDNFVEIDRISSDDGFRIMRDFTRNLPSEHAEAKAELQEALSRRSPFQQFKNTIEDYPDLRLAYFKFKDAAHLKLAQDWLEDNDIECELVNPAKSE